MTSVCIYGHSGIIGLKLQLTILHRDLPSRFWFM